MLKLTEAQIIEIAGEIEASMICNYHIKTGKLEIHPDPDDIDFEPEFWQEVIDKVENDASNYINFYPMDSRQDFNVMVKFAEAATDVNFQQRLFDSLDRKSPFRKFKDAVDDSDYRQDWFDFKKIANIEYVKEQLQREIDTNNQF